MTTSKGPCRYIVYASGPQGFPHNYVRAQVCTIELHEPLGALNFIPEILFSPSPTSHHV